MFGTRVMIADEDHRARQRLKEILTQAGYAVIADTDDGRRASHYAFNMQPELVIIDSNIKGRDGLQLARVLDEQRLAPVILTTEDRSWHQLEQAKLAGVYACLTKPVSEFNVIPAVELALSTFNKLSELERQNRILKADLENRKLVEKAKELLVSQRGYTEDEAFRHIRKISMDKATPMGKVARAIINKLR